MGRLKVAILYGGCSEENPVSVKSAREFARHLDTDKYEPLWVGISDTGAWHLYDGPDAAWGSGRPAILSPDRDAHGLLVLDAGRYESIRVDAALPVLHGKFGEDGAVQGLLEFAGIPYAGCGIQGSMLCMDKSLAYLVVRDAGIATPNFQIVTAKEDIDAAAIDFPVVVKPARSGSSFGVTKVHNAAELGAAVADASQYDAKVLIEETVVGTEVGCAILGSGADLIAGEVDQITVSHGVFRPHQEANPEGGFENSTITVPADLPEDTRDLVRDTAKAIYRALECRGLSRVDLFLTEDGTVVLNEVNTFPGMTTYSRYPQMMAAAGIPMSELIDRMVSLALKGKTR